MIGRLTGTLVSEEVDGTSVLDVRGVGYELLLPLGTSGRAKKNEGGEVTLHIHTHVREDQFSLFGFATAEDRMVFRTLIGISGVGPKTAIGMLSALSSDELARAVTSNDTKTLTSVPGIGKKTAERLVLELRDKLTVSGATHAPSLPPAKATPSNAKKDLLVGALTRMGYKEAQAQRAVQALDAQMDTADLAVLVRESLAILSV